ncbi:endonuclease VII [Shigella phage ESh4]|nr:endonuclease VII [Shigella phage ESh4]
MENIESMRFKKCFKCGAVKPLKEFYKHKRMADGHLNKCKECTKKDVTKNRWDNIDEKRDYDKKRGNRQDKEYLKQWRNKFPGKYKAHNALNNALRDGKVEKSPCEICGSEKSVAHHDDYSKPLSVRWLCQAHHKQWHRDNGEGLNA